MRKNEFKLISRYLGRFFEGPVFTKQKFAAAGRYFICVILLPIEKIRGLDYTMVYNSKDETPHNSVYTKAPRHVLKKVFKDLPYEKKLNFIDIGCGKGYVVKEAYKYSFHKVGGVEYTKLLCDICKNNLKKMHLDASNIANCDAREFECYKEFNVFFMNNPFDETILCDVMDRIRKAHPRGGIRVYYLNPVPARHDTILAAGFELKKQLQDSCESYFLTNVYRVSNGKPEE